MALKVFSSLIKVFSDEEPCFDEIKSVSLLKNEKSGFFAAFYSDENENANVKISSDISEFIKLYLVKDVPVNNYGGGNPDDYYLRNEPGMFPDILVPFSENFETKKNTWCSVYIEINSDNKISGKHNIDIEINGEKASVQADIKDVSLPKQTLKYTNWYHSDCLCDYYGIKAMSDDYWRINRNFIKEAASHGQNIILTPLFTPPLDTFIGGERTTVQLVRVKKSGGKYIFDLRNLKKWVDMCLECGIEYFEMSHLFTQWGAKHAPKIVAIDKKGREKKIFGWSTRTSSRAYDDFLRQFSVALKQFIYNEKLEKSVYFHISDEHGTRAMKVYRKRAKLIKEIFGEFPVMDALSDYDFFRLGAVTIPVPSETCIDNFAGKVNELWTYYCCGPANDYYPNRFIAMPLERVRILGILLWKYNVKGFLQWGYNFYNSRHSISHINPFEVTDAAGAFPAGDAFVVYPGENGVPYPSIRLKAFFDGIQDYTALQLLEKKKGREFALNLVGDITFTDYPHNPDYIINLRKSINDLLAE